VQCLQAPYCHERKGLRSTSQARRLRVGLWKKVTLQTYGLDKYRRTLADVLLLDGTNVDQTLVEDGWCWWYRKYAPGDTVLEGLEKEARLVG
jgi:micrococcal nuclease